MRHVAHRVLRAGAVALAVVVLGSCGQSASGPATTHPGVARPTTSVPTTTATSPTRSTTMPLTTTTTRPPTTTTPTTTATTTVPPAPVLSLGDSGPAVVTLQQRLTALGYWLGPVTGQFGDSTEQAVFALQKAAGIARDGAVGPQTSWALDRGVAPVPRSTTGTLVEVDLSRDLLMVVRDGRLAWTLNTSTGGGYSYVSDGETAVAETPVGVFHVFREVDGMVVSSLGELWRPKYFESGFAIHGAASVPPEPASHGCVRLSDEAIDWIWNTGILPVGMEVWVY